MSAQSTQSDINLIPRFDYEIEDYPDLYPTNFHNLCRRCQWAVKTTGELNIGFCKKCTVKLLLCDPYGAEIQINTCNCPICLEIVTWIKVCSVCLKPGQVFESQVEPIYQCSRCEENQKRLLAHRYRNKDKRTRFVRYPTL